MTTSMCTYELSVATMMSILIMFTECRNSKIRNIPSGGTHAQGIGGSIHMSRHRVLLKIVDHSRYRKMIAVQSLERPPENRRDDPRKKTTSSITRKKL